MLTVTVYGLPAPQGSKRHVGNGVMIESSAKVKPWREAVKFAALAAMERDYFQPRQVFGPVSVEMVFTMPRPKSAKKGAMPSTRPDLSKLIRSTEDALTDVGAWEDDARVVRCVASKVFPGDVDSLASPGAIIRISQAVRGIPPSPQAECADLIGQVFDKMTDAAPVKTPKLEAGDRVTHFGGKWGSDTQVIERIDSEAFPDDAVAFFVGGGFWVTSRLRRVDTLCKFQGREGEPCQKCGKSFHSPDHQAPLFDPRAPR